MKKTKKILSVDDLMRFCAETGMTSFNAKESGYRLSVHVPTVYEIESDDGDYSKEGLMKLKFRLVHTGRNRNGSMITEEDANKAKGSFAYRPILATIHQLDSGEWDFGAHDMEIVEDDDGNEEIVYLEKQVGSFTEEEPFWETDAETGYKYLCAYGIVPTEYSKAAEILRKKKGTKVSTELSVGSASYDVREGALRLEDWYMAGTTLLGRSLSTGEEVEEGMMGARADIVNFSEEENSIVEQLAKMQQSIDVLADKFANFSNIKSLEKGGRPEMFDELLVKYGKTRADITFETDGLSDDELKAKFEEEFGVVEEATPESEENGEVADVEPTSEEVSEGMADSDETTGDELDSVTEAAGEESDTGIVPEDETETGEGPDVDQEESDPASEVSDSAEESASEDVDSTEFSKEYKFTAPNNMEFSISLNKMLSAVADYVNETYCEQDNDYYSVEVFDDAVVMTGWFSRKSYRQKYSYENEIVTLLDTREEVFAEYLTKSEQDALNMMRGSYDELKAFKDEHELEAKQELLEQYAEQLKDSEDFTKLKDDVQKFSMEELELRCNALVGKNAMLTFAKEGPKKAPVVLPFFKDNKKKPSPYGGIFNK